MYPAKAARGARAVGQLRQRGIRRRWPELHFDELVALGKNCTNARVCGRVTPKSRKDLKIRAVGAQLQQGCLGDLRTRRARHSRATTAIPAGLLVRRDARLNRSPRS
jgi:hypothetical protein